MSLVVKVVCWLLKKDLSVSDRMVLTNTLLDRLGALPFSAIIKVSDSGQITVRDKPLDAELYMELKEYAKAALENPAIKLMWEANAFEAVEFGVHQGLNEYHLLFAKTALWNGQQERKFLKELAGTTPLSGS